MTSDPKTKELFEVCRRAQGDQTYCRGLYFDANNLIRRCMMDKGYSFIDMDFYRSRNENPYSIGDWEHGGELKEGMCSWEMYADRKCYQQSLLFLNYNTGSGPSEREEADPLSPATNQ